MSANETNVATWSPEQLALGRRWIEAWKAAGQAMEQLRRNELRRLDAEQAIQHLCGPADYRVPPRAPKPRSGLIEQQRWFKKIVYRD